MNGAVYERLIFIMILNTDFGYNHCKSTENDRLEFSSDKIVPMFFSYLLVTFDITFLKKYRIVIFVKNAQTDNELFCIFLQNAKHIWHYFNFKA